MNDRQIEKCGMLLMGIAIGILMSGILIPKTWETIVAVLFLGIGFWFWLYPPKFLKKLVIFI
jgi:hypothetical protein